jgi:hypothetical protein
MQWATGRPFGWKQISPGPQARPSAHGFKHTGVIAPHDPWFTQSRPGEQGLHGCEQAAGTSKGDPAASAGRSSAFASTTAASLPLRQLARAPSIIASRIPIWPAVDMPCLRGLVFVTCALSSPSTRKDAPMSKCSNLLSVSCSIAAGALLLLGSVTASAQMPAQGHAPPAAGAKPAAPAAAPGAPKALKPMPSPGAKVSAQVGTSEVTVEYSSPGVKKRKIWGELVPYGQPWRTGANSSTKITFTQDVEVGGKPIPAGTYSILTIPTKTTWTVIFNKNTGIGGSMDKYKQEEDVARVTVTPSKIPQRERLAFIFSDVTDDSVTLDLEWEKLRVSIPIKTKKAAS